MKNKILTIAFMMMGPMANAMTVGHYEQKMSDASSDTLIINKDGSMSLESTRQVGGPGGISDEGVVPYPTVCRVKEWGKFQSEDSQYFRYQLKYVHLTNLIGLRDTEHCAWYVGEINGRIQAGQIVYSIKKSDFTITK